MTKSLLLSVGLMLGLGANAQYTYNRSHAPKDGDFNNLVVDTLPQVTKGTAGANQTWDFNDFDFNLDQLLNWQDAANTADAAYFPNAELELGGTYYDLTNDRMEVVGFMFALTGDPQPVYYSNTESVFRFPATYNSTYQDTSMFKTSFYIGQDVGGAQIDSARISNTTRRTVLFDAWGSISTPFGNFTNAIRERSYSIVETKNEACVAFAPGFPCQWVDAGTIDPAYGGSKDTSVVYAWYNDKSPNPLATITYDAKETKAVEATVNNDPSFTGISELVRSSDLVYPNPAADVLYIKSTTATEVQITDLQGRVVLSINQLNGNKVDVSALSAGNYLVTIISADGVKTTKLNIIK